MTNNRKFLIYGKTGWIGGLVSEILTQQGETWEFGTARLEDRAAVMADIERVKPTHIVNAAGVTGRPNVDWCEDHKDTTIRANVIGCLTLADVCFVKNIHMTNFATGCIFHYDDKHKEHSGIGFKEEDEPNFTGSFYSYTKAHVEAIIKHYPNVLTLRVRMPIVKDLHYPRNFITKIATYSKIVDIQNSMTVLPELLPYAIELAKRGRGGIYNFTNPGTISHTEVLELYKEYVNPALSWSIFTVEEQAKVIKAPRSNNELDATKLKNEFPEMLSIRDSLIKYVFEPNRKL